MKRRRVGSDTEWERRVGYSRAVRVGAGGDGDRVLVAGTTATDDEGAPLVDADEISPHPLRATAASHMAGRGLGHSAMMQHFGWADFSVAAAYIETSTDATARQLSALQSR